MTKTINKNLKIALIAVFALALFALVNFSVCDNANANGLNKNVPYSDRLGRFNGDNIPDIMLDIEHNPTTYVEKSWGDYTFNGRSMVWKNDDNHPWADADFYFGPACEYETGNLEFGFSESVDADDDGQGYHDDSFFVHYDKDCPAFIGETQHYKIDITLTCTLPNNEIKKYVISDTFSDFLDDDYNSEILERAGHNSDTKKYGPKLKDILAEVTPQGKENYKFYDALADGTIKAKVTSMEMDYE